MRKNLTRGETPVAFVQAILRAYEKRGVDPAPALQAAGIRGVDLRDPVGHVAIGPFEELAARAMRELDDEGLGWFSRPLPWGSYGMILRASLTSPTLGVALRRWCRHHNLLTGDIALTPRTLDGHAIISVHETADLGDLRPFCLVSLLRNLHGIACWLTDDRILLTEVQFPFAAPPYAEAFRRMFPGRIGFDAPQAGIVFDAAWLRLPILRDDEALRQMLQNPIHLMARIYRQDRPLSRQVEGLLIRAASTAEPDAGAIAARLGISVRSLQRGLMEEGTSLLELKARTRRLRAAELLRRRELPIKRVAHLAGYRNESSFSRAFRRWTGQSPAEFRRQDTADWPMARDGG